MVIKLKTEKIDDEARRRHSRSRQRKRNERLGRIKNLKSGDG